MSPGSIAGDYVARGRSMAVIATDRGCSRQTVARIVREEAGVTPRTNTRRWHIDEPWFRRRYFDDGQTTETIAAELGCSQSTVERFARERAITLRKRGGRHQVAVPPAGAQAILRRAVTDAHSLQRLARFRLLAAGATISAVAASEGLSASTFVTQLQRLERDCGRRLLTRAERGKPLRVTAAGRQLLAAMAATPVTAEAGDLGYPQRQVS